MAMFLVDMLIALVLYTGALVAADVAFDYPLPTVLYLPLFALVWSTHEWLLGRGNESESPVPRWPLSGPLRGVGRFGITVPWYLTQCLCVFNPFQAVLLVRQIAANLRLYIKELRTGNDGTGYETTQSYTLPFEGEWVVIQGGMTRKTSHSWDLLGQRFALDFVQAAENGVRHRARGTRPHDYLCYEQPVLSTADGEVIRAEDRVGLAPCLGWYVCDFMARTFLGNYVSIRHAEREYALYAHLIKGSVMVKPGDTVTRGQRLGLCGHTGHTTEPHLHFHLQDADGLVDGMGLPVRFDNIVVNGIPADDVYLEAGDRVSARTAGGDAEAGLQG